MRNLLLSFLSEVVIAAARCRVVHLSRLEAGGKLGGALDKVSEAPEGDELGALIKIDERFTPPKAELDSHDQKEDGPYGLVAAVLEAGMTALAKQQREQEQPVIEAEVVEAEP